MRRRLFAVRSLLFSGAVSVAIFSPTRAQTPAPTTTAVTAAASSPREEIPDLIGRLSDPDPAVRGAAALRLSALGPAARPALAEALHAGDPELRTEAAQIVLRMPWIDENDPETVKQALAGYGELGPEERVQRVAALDQMPNAVGQSALFRILCDDPAASVRWPAAEALRTQHDGNKPPLQRLREMSMPPANSVAAGSHTRDLPDNPPLLAAAGWAWREVDAKRADELIARAVALEAQEPTAVHGQLDFAYTWLVDRATDQQRYVDALVLLRQQAASTSFNDFGVPAPIAALFALHAEHGPYDGFWTDVRTYRAYLDEPEVLYSLGRLAWRTAHPIASVVIDGVALLAGGASAEKHCRTGGFLTTQGWDGAAERELRVAILLSRGDEVNAYFQLARLAAERGDELGVAQHLEAALTRVGQREMTRTTRFGDVQAWSPDDAWAEVHWHYLRAARSSGNLAEVQKHLEELMRLDRLGQILHKDPGLATDVVPALQDTGRTEDAQKCFDAAYKDLHDVLTASPEDAEAKNNLAWLCARCGQHLDEAVRLADAAVASAPDNAAYLDTDAEAHFRNGDSAGAVRLESRALEFRPEDTFMKEQLARFRLGKPTTR
jgi:tetratricopeptide (TPR) repeat protein